METARLPIWLTVISILGVSVLSGPLVHDVQLTSSAAGSTADDSNTGLENSTLSLEVESLPTQNIHFARTKYGSDTYLLRVPDAVVNVTTLTGRPILVYQIRIPALEHTYRWTHFLDADSTGRQNVTMEPATFSPETISQETYKAQLSLLVRQNGTDEQLAHRNVTVVRQT